jgi:hypothetical protein
MRDFNQVYVSEVLETYFGKDFRSYWSLKNIENNSDPCVFLGLYSNLDFDVWNNHKGPKILYFGGNDMHDLQLNIVKNTKDVFCIGYGGDWLYNKLDIFQIPYTKKKILLKDYEEFKPTPLGDKIYVYRGILGNRESYYLWDEIIAPVMKIVGEDKFIFTDNKTIHELKENYYKNSFLYIKPNEKGGGSAMMELGFMGRMTVTNGHSSFPNAISYNSIDEIVNIIEKESYKIGTLQDGLSNRLKNCFLQTDEWLTLDFYINNRIY